MNRMNLDDFCCPFFAALFFAREDLMKLLRSGEADEVQKHLVVTG